MTALEKSWNEKKDDSSRKGKGVLRKVLTKFAVQAIVTGSALAQVTV